MVVGVKTANYFGKVLPTTSITTESQPWHEDFIARGYKNSHPPFVLEK